MNPSRYLDLYCCDQGVEVDKKRSKEMKEYLDARNKEVQSTSHPCS